ncbi:5'-methylthioadenosine/adenosylhomocysteine nucleosidase [Buchnera aphidicola]|uniref:5'-methylthioadenosine/adenosylhomocysteine nucleosidase n=1 Tax=Buchnera aphidicola TaxID=9 RepID=UPI00346416D5
MKIGIIGAIKKEIVFLIKIIRQYHIKKIENYKFYSGYLHDINVIILKSGIGKVSASIVTTLLISYYNPDIIINIGSAGSISPLLNIKNIIIPNKTCYHDVDVSIFNYSIGQIPLYPRFFFINTQLLALAKLCMLNINCTFKEGLILTGDSFVYKKKSLLSILNNFPSALAIDMESTSITQVCYIFKKPVLILRSISDCANKYAHLSFNKHIEEASYRVTLVIEEIIKNISILKK